MAYIFEFFGIYLFLMYLAMPLLVWKKNKLPAQYELEPVEDKVSFFSERDEKYIQHHQEIQKLGFNYAGSGQFVNGGTHTSFSMYRNPDLGLFGFVNNIKGTAMSLTYIEFTQMYADRTVLNVNNSPVGEVFPRSSLKITFQYPDVHDVKTLLAITKKIVADNHADKKKFFYAESDVFVVLRSFLNRELDDLVESGYVSDTITNGHRDLTLKGAYLMSWKLLWPIKQLRHAMQVKKAKRALAKAEHSN